MSDTIGSNVFKTCTSEKWFRIGELTKSKTDDGIIYSVALSFDEQAFYVEYTMKRLNVSKFWPIRKIQLWAIKKAFK